MMQAKIAIALLVVAAPVHMNAARSATQQEPEEEEVTMIPVEEGDEVTVEAVDSADVFTVEAGSTPVEEENKENPDSLRSHLPVG